MGSPFDYDDEEEPQGGAGFAAALRDLGAMPKEDGPDSLQATPRVTAAPSDQAEDTAQATAPPPDDDDATAHAMMSIQPPAAVQLKPYADHSADYTAMAAQKAAENPAAYKASGWRRALAGIAGGMVAAGSRSPQAGMSVGEGVLDAPLNRARAQWAAAEAPIQSRIDAGKAQDEQTYRANQNIEQQGRINEQDFRNRSLAVQNQARAQNYTAEALARRNAPIAFVPNDPKNPYAGGTVTTADGRRLPNQAPYDKWLANWERDPANKMLVNLRRVQIMKDAGMQLTPEDEKIIGSGGEVKATPRTTIHMPSAESEEYRDLKASFVRENKRQPTTAELEGLISSRHPGRGANTQGTRNQFSHVEEDTSNAYRKVEEEFAQGLIDVAELNKQKAQIAQTNSSRTRDLGGVPAEDAGPAQAAAGPAAQPTAAPALPAPGSKPAPAATAAAPTTQPVKVPSGKSVKIGDPVTFQGKTGTVTGIKNGKPIVRWSGAL